MNERLSRWMDGYWYARENAIFLHGECFGGTISYHDRRIVNRGF